MSLYFSKMPDEMTLAESTLFFNRLDDIFEPYEKYKISCIIN